MKKVCEVCGKEFETKYSYAKKCPECYFKTAKEEGNVNPKAVAPAKKTVQDTSLPTDTEAIVTEIKKAYDEVVAQFASDYPEIIGDPATLQALVSTAYIEKNKRLRREKY